MKVTKKSDKAAAKVSSPGDKKMKKKSDSMEKADVKNMNNHNRMSIDEISYKQAQEKMKKTYGKKNTTKY